MVCSGLWLREAGTGRGVCSTPTSPAKTSNTARPSPISTGPNSGASLALACSAFVSHTLHYRIPATAQSRNASCIPLAYLHAHRVILYRSLPGPNRNSRCSLAVHSLESPPCSKHEPPRPQWPVCAFPPTHIPHHHLHTQRHNLQLRMHMIALGDK